MPIQAPQWTDYLNCPICCREFGAPPRSPISLSCGHTFCKHCIKHLHRKQCPFDQAVIQVEPDELAINTALLQLAGLTPPSQPHHPPCIQALEEEDRDAYDVIVRCMEQLAVYLKYCCTANNNVVGSRLSRPMQRKLVTLLQCPMTDEEGRGKAARAARSLGERTVTELILQHQNPQQLSANLWAAVRARGCQFLGPAMQEEVLKLVLLALEDGSALSRKVLVMFVVQRLEPHFSQASKTSIGHVVQLLYRASCFKVSKRECDSSLMQLKEEFRSYDSLRREHDAQIVQIATEAGLRIAPDQWSALLYGDTAHKSHMQSIIDKLQSPQSFAQSVQELFIALQRTGDTTQLVDMSTHLDRLANIDSAPDMKCPSWQKLAEIMTSLKEVVTGLVHYLQQQITNRDASNTQKYNLEPSTSQTIHISSLSSPSKVDKYNMSFCTDSMHRNFCPRGINCPFIHTNDDFDIHKMIVAQFRNSNQHNNLSNTSNVLPPSIQPDINHNVPQGLPDAIPQDVPPPFVPQCSSQGFGQPAPKEGSIPQIQQEHIMQGQDVRIPQGYPKSMPQNGIQNIQPRQNVRDSSLPVMIGFHNNVQYVYPHPALYHRYGPRGQLRRPIYQQHYSPDLHMQNYHIEYLPIIRRNTDAPLVTICQDPKHACHYPYNYQNTPLPNSNLLSHNEIVPENTVPQYSMMSHMFPQHGQASQFQDVPENAEAMFETPSYVPMAINMKPEAPWSPANRQKSSNTTFNETFPGSSSNIANNQSDDTFSDGEELQEQMSALEKYLTNEYKLGE